MTEETPQYGDGSVVFRRSGKAPLRLEGFRLLARATSRSSKGSRESRWHEIELWADESQPDGDEQRCCLVIRWRSTWEGEDDRDYAELVERGLVPQELAGYSATRDLVGYPPGAQFEERQLALKQAIRTGWEKAVSEVLEAAGVFEDPDGPAE